MAQNELNYGENPSGADLMDVYLAGMAENQLTLHSGNSRPPYVQQGTMWLNTSANPYILYVFDGTVDVKVGEFNITNKTFKANDTLNVVHLTGAETVDGNKTFNQGIQFSPMNGRFISVNSQYNSSDVVSSDENNFITSVYKDNLAGNYIQLSKTSSGVSAVSLNASTYLSNGTRKTSSLVVACDKNNNEWTACPAPTQDTTNSTQIDTVGARNTKLQDYAKKTDIIKPNLLDFKWSAYELNDQNWLRSDTFSWQSGDVYKQVYDLLVSEYNSTTDEAPLSDGLVHRHSQRGLNIVTPTYETHVTNRYNDSSNSFFFILDTANKRFKLPRTKWGFKQVRDKIGNAIAESLPNITGTFGGITRAGTGAFTSTGNIACDTSTSVTGGRNYDFNASRSSSVYKDGAHVQERANEMYLYFYVGGFSQTATEQTAGLNAELFNGKVDKDSSWGFPSSRYINLTLGASGAYYTAPANGWFLFRRTATASGQYLQLVNNTAHGLQYFIQSASSGTVISVSLPVKKGDVVGAAYNAGSTDNQLFRFIYAEGSN